jgi:hypothetical protein
VVPSFILAGELSVRWDGSDAIGYRGSALRTAPWTGSSDASGGVGGFLVWSPPYWFQFGCRGLSLWLRRVHARGCGAGVASRCTLDAMQARVQCGTRVCVHARE